MVNTGMDTSIDLEGFYNIPTFPIPTIFHYFLVQEG